MSPPLCYYPNRQPAMSHVLQIAYPSPTIILQDYLLSSRLGCCPHCFRCPSWRCVILGVFPLPPQTLTVPPRIRHSYQPTFVAVGLLTTLMYLYVLGVGGVGWTPLEPTCTPVTISQLPALYLTTTSDPLDRISGLT